MSVGLKLLWSGREDRKAGRQDWEEGGREEREIERKGTLVVV